MADSEFTWEQGEERIVIHGAGGRIDFVRVGERWTHDLRLVTTGWAVPADWPATIASSVEVDAERDPPNRIVSPVYQEIQRHEFSAEHVSGQCVLVTGKVFKHIFSAAITLSRDANEPAFTVLDIDVADRCREPVDSLAATYLVRLGSSELVEAGPNAITWSGGAIGDARLQLICGPPGRLALAEAGRQATRVQALAANHPGDLTQRLHYRWRWAAAREGGPEITL